MRKTFVPLLFAALLPLFGVGCTPHETAVEHKTTLSDGWKVQSSAQTAANGAELSSAGASVQGWFDASVPSTVMGVLTANGFYADLLDGTNYKTADRTPFDVSWWYRTEFQVSADDLGQYASLEFDGVTYCANVWLNGYLVAPVDAMYGPFRQFSFDVTGLLQEKNFLAVEVFRAGKGEPNIGFVDWNPRPLDENMGIFREVHLSFSGPVSMKDTWVRSELADANRTASLFIETTLTNRSDKDVDGKLNGSIEDKRFSIPVALRAGETRTIKITPDDTKSLVVKNPRLWWSSGMGDPEMYELALAFETAEGTSDCENIAFGIRSIDTYFTPEGHRGFILNGEKVLVKSAGWTDDIFLRDTHATNEIQVQYVHDMGLNSIRFENVWGNSRNIYELCDRYGLLALVGWSCQWEWEVYLGTPDDEFGCIRSEHDMDLLAESLRDQIVWLRNHPSIIAWMVGSDKLPRPELEARYLAIYPLIEDRPYLGAAKALTSELSGPTGMKMAGPYEYVGPNYWFEDRSYGGAYGFNTETGPGAEVPIEESVRKMIPADKMWPVNEAWDFHCTTAPTDFNSMEVTTRTIEAKYGKPANLKQFLERAHLLSYESVKSMFEAFRVNKQSGATGIVQWMLNSAWPSIYWQLYDFYLVPTSAYYGARQANAPVQLIYNYADNHIYAVNATLDRFTNLKAAAEGYGMNSELLYAVDEIFTLEANSVVKLFEADNSAANTFLFLTLSDSKGERLAGNEYVLANKYDVHDWAATEWTYTPISGHADFTALTSLPAAALDISVLRTAKGVTVELHNTSAGIAFFNEMLLKSDDGEVLRPVFWEDNYFSVLPGQKRIIECTFTPEILPASKTANLQIKGWNTETSVVNIK